MALVLLLLRAAFWLPVALAQGGSACPYPTQPGAPTTCKMWLQASQGVTCQIFADLLRIPEKDFEAANPQLEGNCQKNFWAGYGYCGDAPSKTAVLGSTASVQPTYSVVASYHQSAQTGTPISQPAQGSTGSPSTSPPPAPSSSSIAQPPVSSAPPPPGTFLTTPPTPAGSAPATTAPPSTTLAVVAAFASAGKTICSAVDTGECCRLFWQHQDAPQSISSWCTALLTSTVSHREFESMMAAVPGFPGRDPVREGFCGVPQCPCSNAGAADVFLTQACVCFLVGVRSTTPPSIQTSLVTTQATATH